MQRAVIRVGDRTSHGGIVLTGDQTINVYGQLAARKGDMTTCPKCKGAYPIVEGTPCCGSDRLLALEGMRTACGATLIASQHFWTEEYGQGAGTTTTPYSVSPCPHPDVAADIAQWLVEQMNKNPLSDVGQRITAENSYDIVKETESWNALPWYGKLGGMPNFASIAAGSKIAAYGLWASKVGPRLDWDYKVNIPKDYPTAKPSKGWYKYLGYDYYIDIWANIHYGYVGMAVGFNSDELLGGAGFAQWGDDIYSDIMDKKFPAPQNNPVNGSWPKSADDVSDNISIRLGIDLYAAAAPGSLTADLLLKRMSEVPVPWGRPSSGAKRQHVCETK